MWVRNLGVKSGASMFFLFGPENQIAVVYGFAFIQIILLAHSFGHVFCTLHFSLYRFLATLDNVLIRHNIIILSILITNNTIYFTSYVLPIFHLIVTWTRFVVEQCYWWQNA